MTGHDVIVIGASAGGVEAVRTLVADLHAADGAAIEHGRVYVARPDHHTCSWSATGALDDGAAGLSAIKRRGGLALVQHPEDAHFPGMPRHAIQAVRPDVVVPLARMGAVLSKLVAQPAGEEAGSRRTSASWALLRPAGIRSAFEAFQEE